MWKKNFKKNILEILIKLSADDYWYEYAGQFLLDWYIIIERSKFLSREDYDEFLIEAYGVNEHEIKREKVMYSDFEKMLK